MKIHVTQAAIEAAAKAMHDSQLTEVSPRWEFEVDTQKKVWRRWARTALKAAQDHLKVVKLDD